MSIDRLVHAALLAAVLIGSPFQGAAQVATADAQAFVGDWEATMQAPGGSFEFQIHVRDQNGQLAGEVTGPQGDTSAVQEFARAGEELTLVYVIEMGGQRADVRLTLAPSGEGLDVMLDMAGGQFRADGVAERVASG